MCREQSAANDSVSNRPLPSTFKTSTHTTQRTNTHLRKQNVELVSLSRFNLKNPSIGIKIKWKKLTDDSQGARARSEQGGEIQYAERDMGVTKRMTVCAHHCHRHHQHCYTHMTNHHLQQPHWGAYLGLLPRRDAFL